VSAFDAPHAIGSDTGGSIRQPSALTGIVGFRSTYGAVSRYGLIAYSSSLDQAGPFGRTVLDTAMLHETIAGHDAHDATSINAQVPAVVAAAKSGVVKGMKIGVIKQLQGEGYQKGVQTRFTESLEALASLGAEIVEVDCPSFEYALAAYYLIAPSEASSNLARFDAMRYGLRVGDVDGASAEAVMNITRDAGFGREVKRRIILGTYALSSGYYDAYYGSAQKIRTLIIQEYAKAFSQADVLVSPTAPTTAFKIGEKVDDPMAMYLADVATIPVNLAGICGMSLPAGLADEDGLPVGFQIMAPAMQDQRLYLAGAALEASLLSKWGAPILSKAPSLGGVA
jgi:aspartyl-tRNA(Asn)/glutamyl-tRNA(Gln) amidotransferase subunit A